MDDLKNIVSKNVPYLRTNSKMTQLESGNLLGCSDKAVSKRERGGAVPDACVLNGATRPFYRFGNGGAVLLGIGVL